MLKEKILKYLDVQTKTIDLDHLGNQFTAGGIANKLKAKRNTVSLYLNQLVNEHKLIKIRTRPVHFVHRARFEKDNFKFKTIVYQSVSQI